MTDEEWQFELCANKSASPSKAWQYMLQNIDGLHERGRDHAALDWIEARVRVITGYYLRSEGRL